jgi:hypothetical protein
MNYTLLYALNSCAAGWEKGFYTATFSWVTVKVGQYNGPFPL